MTITDNVLNEFSKLAPLNQYATLLNLFSLENPDVRSEFVEDNIITRLLPKHEAIKHVISHLISGNGSSNIAKDMISAAKEDYFKYITLFHPEDKDYIGLWELFEQNLDTKNSKKFFQILNKEINKITGFIDSALVFNGKVAGNDVPVGCSKNKKLNNHQYKNFDGALVVVKPLGYSSNPIRKFMTSYMTSRIFKGLTGAAITGVIDKEYRKRELSGKFEIFEQTPLGVDLTSLVENKPDYVMISLPSDRALNYGLLTAKKIRDNCPDTKILIGGKIFGSAVKPSCDITKEFDSHHEHIRNYVFDTGLVDTIMIGRAEENIPLFLDDLVKGSTLKDTYRGDKTNFIISPSYHAETNNREVGYLLSVSEGCKDKPCTFCSAGQFSAGFIIKPIEQIEKEIIELKAAKNQEKLFVLITDDNPWSPLMRMHGQNGDYLRLDEKKKRVVQISDLFKKHRVSYISFLDSVVSKDAELMKTLADGGLRLGLIGIESINQTSLKKMDKQNKVSDYGQIARNFNDNGAYSNVTYILDPEVDTIDSAKEAGKTLRELGFDYVNFFIKTPFFGTSDFIDLQTKLLDPYESTERRNLVNQTYRTEHTSVQTSYLMLDAAYKEFYNLNYFINKSRKFRKNDKKENLGLNKTFVKIAYSLGQRFGFRSVLA